MAWSRAIYSEIDANKLERTREWRLLELLTRTSWVSTMAWQPWQAGGNGGGGVLGKSGSTSFARLSSFTSSPTAQNILF